MISLAYEVARKDEELGHLHSLWVHESCALSASWDALQNVSVGDIMAACRWLGPHLTQTSQGSDLEQ